MSGAITIKLTLQRAGRHWRISDGNGCLLALVESHGPDDDAAARMMAAAPELVAALAETVQELEAAYDDGAGARPTGTSAVIRRAHAALQTAGAAVPVEDEP